MYNKHLHSLFLRFLFKTGSYDAFMRLIELTIRYCNGTNRYYTTRSFFVDGRLKEYVFGELINTGSDLISAEDKAIINYIYDVWVYDIGYKENNIGKPEDLKKVMKKIKLVKNFS